MDIFSLITTNSNIEKEILAELVAKGYFIKSDNTDSFFVFRSEEDMEKLNVARAGLIISSFKIDEYSDEYDENDKEFIKSVLKSYPYCFLNISYKINYTYNILYDVIPILNNYVIMSKQSNSVVIEDDFSGYLSSFRVFLEKWNKQRAFFHQKDYKREQEFNKGWFHR